MNKILNELACWNIRCHIHNKSGFNSVTIKKKTHTRVFINALKRRYVRKMTPNNSLKKNCG